MLGLPLKMPGVANYLSVIHSLSLCELNLERRIWTKSQEKGP